jgi:multiple sugar transport system ATP-binding protein
MNKGVIQQVGTPTEIYDRPNNIFVAGFIGSPAMNLIEGQISNGTFEADNVKISGFGRSLSGKVTLGFRAEDAEISKKGNATAPLYSIELLGDATISTMRLGGAICSVKGPKDHRAEIGSSVSALISQKVCHLFDPTNGERIS